MPGKLDGWPPLVSLTLRSGTLKGKENRVADALSRKSTGKSYSNYEFLWDRFTGSGSCRQDNRMTWRGAHTQVIGTGTVQYIGV
jgi:hypothetical protein